MGGCELECSELLGCIMFDIPSLVDLSYFTTKIIARQS